MPPPPSIAVVGLGLSGSFAALALARHGWQVTLFDGGGGAATDVGLAHPFTARKGRPAWRFAEAVRALSDAAALCGASPLLRPGVLRPARAEDQAAAFGAVAREHPDWATWMSPRTAAERFPQARAPLGALWIPRGYSVSIAPLLRALQRVAVGLGATVERLPVSRVDGGDVLLEGGARRAFDYVLLCVGAGFGRFPALAGRGLHAIKGQVVAVARPTGLPDLPAVSSGGYVITEADRVVIGASYEHDFDGLEPSAAVTEDLLQRGARLVPGLDGAPVVGTSVGVRVTRPGRMPLLGPVSEDGRVWAFAALGSKGLLSAPLLAAGLPAYLGDPDRIPPEVRPSSS